MAYSSGKYAYGICDISGVRYKLKDMKRTWNGLLVGPDQYEPKHPQLDPPTVSVDSEALFRTRPEVPLPQAQLGLVTVEGGLLATSDIIGTKFEGAFGTTAVGTVTVSIG
jgi:hypothetical protein